MKNLKGVKILSKKSQQTVKGGKVFFPDDDMPFCEIDHDCPYGYICNSEGICIFEEL